MEAGFTAVQAAQKIRMISELLDGLFTAVQAAQKGQMTAHGTRWAFTAVQAAQKRPDRLALILDNLHCRAGSSEKRSLQAFAAR